MSDETMTNSDVFAVQCPNPKCRKFMLIEEHERQGPITCMICKKPFRVGDQPQQPAAPKNPSSK